MGLQWTLQALGWLQEIVDYIAQDFPERAQRFASRLRRAVERLQAHPYSDVVLSEDPRYRVLIVSGYRIVYRVFPNRVIIAMVLSPGLHIETALNRWRE